jgi:hypothetical protein
VKRCRFVGSEVAGATQIASGLQASGFRGDVTAFRLNATAVGPKALGNSARG